MTPIINGFSIDKKYYFKIYCISLVLAFLSVFYIDFFSFEKIGFYITVALFVFTLFLSTKNLTFGIVLVIFLSIYLPDNPRNIINLYSNIQVDKTITYYSLGSITVFKFSFLNLLFSYNSMLSIFKLSSSAVKINLKHLLILSSFLFIGFLALIISILSSEVIIPKSIFSEMRFPVFLMMGYFQGLYLVNRNKINLFISTLFLLPVFIGIRVFLFFILDMSNGNTTYYFATNTLLSMSTLFYISMSRSCTIYKNFIFRIPLYASLIEPSRGFLLIFFIIFLLTVFIRVLPIKLKTKLDEFYYIYFIEFFLIAFVCFVFIGVYNADIIKFFFWKMGVFNELLDSNAAFSESGSLRICEFKNIVSMMTKSFFVFFIGKGFGGTYNFTDYPFTGISTLDLKSFTIDQLTSGIFYTTHSFSSFILLKYGLIGLILYLIIPIVIILKSIQRIHRSNEYLYVLLIALISIYYYYWNLVFAYILAVCLSMMIKGSN